MPLLGQFSPDLADAELRTLFRELRPLLGRVGAIVIASPDGSHYLCEWGGMRRFGLDTECEEPREFRSPAAFRRWVAKCRAMPVREPEVCGGVWVCEGAEFRPNEKYMRLTGVRFPGCPTQ